MTTNFGVTETRETSWCTQNFKSSQICSEDVGFGWLSSVNCWFPWYNILFPCQHTCHTPTYKGNMWDFLFKKEKSLKTSTKVLTSETQKSQNTIFFGFTHWCRSFATFPSKNLSRGSFMYFSFHVERDIHLKLVHLKINPSLFKLGPFQ